MEEVMEDVHSCILISQDGIAVSDVQKEYRELYNKELPYRQYAPSLQGFLRMMADKRLVRMSIKMGREIVHGLATEDTVHITDLIQKQKSKKKKGKKNRSRYPPPMQKLSRSQLPPANFRPSVNTYRPPHSSSAQSSSSYSGSILTGGPRDKIKVQPPPMRKPVLPPQCFPVKPVTPTNNIPRVMPPNNIPRVMPPNNISRVMPPGLTPNNPSQISPATTARPIVGAVPQPSPRIVEAIAELTRRENIVNTEIKRAKLATSLRLMLSKDDIPIEQFSSSASALSPNLRESYMAILKQAEQQLSKLDLSKVVKAAATNPVAQNVSTAGFVLTIASVSVSTDQFVFEGTVKSASEKSTYVLSGVTPFSCAIARATAFLTTLLAFKEVEMIPHRAPNFVDVIVGADSLVDMLVSLGYARHSTPGVRVLDEMKIPASTRKFRATVVHVVNPGKVFLQIQEDKPKENLAALKRQLAQFYQITSNRHFLEESTAFEGQLCVVCDGSYFVRAKVLHIPTHAGDKWRVELIDSGKIVTSPKTPFCLHARFMDRKLQRVVVNLADLTLFASENLTKLVESRLLGRTFMVLRVSSATATAEYPLVYLHPESPDVLHLPEQSINRRLVAELRAAVAPTLRCEDTFEVKFSDFDVIFLNHGTGLRYEVFQCLSDLLKDLDTTVKADVVTFYEKKLEVAGLFEGGIYRARMKGYDVKTQKVELDFFDYGNIETVNFADIFPLPWHLSTEAVPAQALPVKLATLPPPGHMWQPQGIERLAEYLGQNLPVTVQVTSSPNEGAAVPYVVMYLDGRVNLNVELFNDPELWIAFTDDVANLADFSSTRPPPGLTPEETRLPSEYSDEEEDEEEESDEEDSSSVSDLSVGLTPPIVPPMEVPPISTEIITNLLHISSTFPIKFYCNSIDYANREKLEELMIEMIEVYPKLSPVRPGITKAELGQFVVVRKQVGGNAMFYRARVINIVQATQRATVKFCDYLADENVHLSTDVYQLLPQFAKLPQQGFQLHLDDMPDLLNDAEEEKRLQTYMTKLKQMRDRDLKVYVTQVTKGMWVPNIFGRAYPVSSKASNEQLSINEGALRAINGTKLKSIHTQ